VRTLEQTPRPAGVRLLDGGTGGVNLLSEFEGVSAVVLIDATYDGQPAGTVTHLRPQRIADLPRGLGAHDFGVKDLFAAAALLGLWPELHVFTISIAEMRPMCTELSPPVAHAVPIAVREVGAHLARLMIAVP
jgi:hydrogenase maturation protease